MKALLIYPHQLFEKHPGLAAKPDIIAVCEDPLFFGSDHQYPINFHTQKLMLHRASMRHYAQALSSSGHTVSYAEHSKGKSSIPQVVNRLAKKGITEILVCDLADYALHSRLTASCSKADITLTWLDTPGFINTETQNAEYRAGKKRWFMADFYKWQRQRLNVLVDSEGQPSGGKWSFDDENRKKLPKKKLPDLPALTFAEQTDLATEAAEYVASHFPSAFSGATAQALLYPHTHKQAQRWLDEFLSNRFAEFGPYEDAIVEDQNWLYHSVLTPMLNTGLLTPAQVVTVAQKYATKHDIPIASVEGFIRQIIGWREFMRATYTDLGVPMRTTNHWQHHNPMPKEFYNGNTGMPPVDNAIGRILDTGYCHHIERLMVLGGFMFLCEIDPEAIYQWFMELFIDSYDWVMVTNVYAMSQNADGGLITTKPYFSGSNYVRKMSHYPKGDWCDTWDALYWRWIIKHSASLGKNPRWAMMVRTAEKFDDVKRENYTKIAESYLNGLHATT